MCFIDTNDHVSLITGDSRGTFCYVSVSHFFFFCLRFEILPFFVCHKYNRPLFDFFLEVNVICNVTFSGENGNNGT